MDDDTAAPVAYGVTPADIMASMPGLDFVRAIFSGKLPAPPIMQTVEPFDSTAEPGMVVMYSVPGFRHYNPIGSVHGGYSAILLDRRWGSQCIRCCRRPPAIPRSNSRSVSSAA